MKQESLKMFLKCCLTTTITNVRRPTHEWYHSNVLVLFPIRLP